MHILSWIPPGSVQVHLESALNSVTYYLAQLQTSLVVLMMPFPHVFSPAAFLSNNWHLWCIDLDAPNIISALFLELRLLLNPI